MITPEQKRRMVREDERHFLHNQFFRIGVAVIILVPLVWLGIVLLTHGLRQRELGRELAAAREAMSSGDEAAALARLDSALGIDPVSPEALEMAGDLARSQRPVDYLRLRLLLDKASPASTPAKLKLARAALENNALDVADDALARVPESDRSQPGYLAAVAARAWHLGDAEAAVAALEQAIERASDPGPHMLDLAAILVASGNPGAAEFLVRLGGVIPAGSERHVELQRIRRDDFLARGMPGKALEPAMEVLASGGAGFDDRKRALAALCGGGEAATPARLARVLSEAGSPEEAHRLGLHLLGLRPPATLDAVLVLLPDALRRSPHASALAAASLAQSGQWPALAGRLDEQGWPGLDYLHAAYSALAQRRTRPDSAWKARWSEAMRLAAASKSSLELLFLTISLWPGWQDETIRALWKFVESGNQVPEALDKLGSHYRATGDDGGLLRVLAAKLERAPSETALRAEYARLCLLRRVNEGEARRIAAECHRSEPGLPAVVVTQAFALSTVDRHEEAIALMRTLPGSSLEVPLHAAYMAIILEQAGRGGEAAAHLKAVRRGELLAAERALLPR